MGSQKDNRFYPHFSLGRAWREFPSLEPDEPEDVIGVRILGKLNDNGFVATFTARMLSSEKKVERYKPVIIRTVEALHDAS